MLNSIHLMAIFMIPFYDSLYRTLNLIDADRSAGRFHSSSLHSTSVNEYAEHETKERIVENIIISAIIGKHNNYKFLMNKFPKTSSFDWE